MVAKYLKNKGFRPVISEDMEYIEIKKENDKIDLTINGTPENLVDVVLQLMDNNDVFKAVILASAELFLEDC